MATWKVSTKEKKSVEEREIWTHPKKGTIERRTGFRWGAYLVTTDGNQAPKFELVEVPGGDGVADSIDMNFCGYDTELIGLEDGCYLDIIWSENLDSKEREKLESIWEEDSEDGWENLGWMLDDTEVWFWGELNIELLSSDSGDDRAVSSANHEIEESVTDWFPENITPIRNGLYEIELVSSRVWPSMSITHAKWNGHEWINEAGDKLEIKCWRGLLKNYLD